LRDFGLEYHPQLIILQYYMNDFNDSLPRKSAINDYYVAFYNYIINRSILVLKTRQLREMISHTIFHDIRRKYFINTLNDNDPKNTMNYLTAKPDDNEVNAFNYLKLI
jgi:hypothetical protein